MNASLLLVARGDVIDLDPRAGELLKTIQSISFAIALQARSATPLRLRSTMLTLSLGEPNSLTPPRLF